jgi:dethiobiotin synthetase
MTRKPVKGLFLTGTSTGVGKTYVGAAIARWLVAAGCRVGVYKPVASGCRTEGGELISDDAVLLWKAAGKPKTLTQVCPQKFTAPLAAHLAAAAEGKQIDAELLRTGLQPWLADSDVVLVEGAGGLMSPITDDEYVADLAFDLGFPLVVVAANELGVINQVLQTLIVAATFREGLEVAGVVLNQPKHLNDDMSIASNRRQIERHALSPVLAELPFQASEFDRAVHWYDLGSERASRAGSQTLGDE